MAKQKDYFFSSSILPIISSSSTTPPHTHPSHNRVNDYYDEDNGTLSPCKNTTTRRVTRRLNSTKNNLSQSHTMSWLLLFLVIFMEMSTAPPVWAMSQQYFRRTPDNQTATVGDMVTLACSVINKSGVLQWTRDGFGLGTERNLVGYERYRMSGSEEEGIKNKIMLRVR